MIAVDLLPVLRLRRQAAARGWRIVRIDREAGQYDWRHLDPEEGGTVSFDTAAHVSVGDAMFAVPDRLKVDTPMGRMKTEHLCNVAAVLRAYFGWPEPDEDSAVWPPKSTELVPVALYQGGAQ